MQLLDAKLNTGFRLNTSKLVIGRISQITSELEMIVLTNYEKPEKYLKKIWQKNLKNNNKSFWNYVNSKSKSKSRVNDLKDSSGAFKTDDLDKARILNMQYSKTFTEENTTSLVEFPEQDLYTAPLTNIVVQQDKVKNLLLNMRKDKSSGPDKKHPRVMNEAAEQIASPLTILYQMSIDQGKLPQQWKLANITPIFKKGSKSEPANYRPVSLTSVICKIFEKIIGEHILAHAKENLIIPNQQHGFLSGKSTSTNLLEALNIWMEMLEHGQPIDVLYLDYAKAFDTVPHQKLIQKLKSLGIQGNLLKWL